MNFRAAFLATAMLTTSAAAIAQVPAPVANATTPAPAAGAAAAVQSSVQAPATAAAPAPATTASTPTMAASAAVTPGAAAPVASATAQVAAGASVSDTKGGAVGTIASVNGDVAVVDTGMVKASIPVASFAKTDKGLLISMTKAELEAAAQGARQEANAAMKPGVAVVDTKGGAVGTIEAIEGDLVTVATPNLKAKLPKSAIAMGPNGAVITMTQAQLEAAAKGSEPPAG